MPVQQPVFMAIAEQVGHGRRGEIRYLRGPDGVERLQIREAVERWESGGKIEETIRRREERVLADDLPWIAEQYRRHVRGEEIEPS